MKFKSEVQLEALNNAAVDTDKFLVSDSSTVKYRTGTQVLSDIGGQAALTNPITGTGTLNFVSKFTGSTTLGNSVMYDNGTNVGIGTTSPGARLEVKSAAPNTFFANFISSTGSGSAKIYENSNSHPLLYIADADGTTTIVLNSSGVSYLTSGNIIIGGTADNGDLLQVQGTSYFDGNVGIGTVNPLSKLDISGAVKIDTDGTYGSEYGMVGFGGTTDGYNRIFGRTTTADGLFLASATGRGIFFRANGGNTDHMVVIASGNVGIGTTSPGTKLDVSGVITATGGTSTEWNTAYDNRIISLTTTGTSGAATLISNVLNIPNYADGQGVTSVGGTAPIVSSGGTTPYISITAATTGAAGSMSAADKAKLDGIAAGAQVNVGTNIAQGTRTATTVPVTSSTGTSATLAAATTSLAGVMTSADKTKLDGIAAGAQVNVATNLGITAGTTAGPIVTSSTGTDATLPTASATASGVVTTGAQTWAGTKTFSSTIAGSINGNAATATTLQTARTIAGVSFNGSADISLNNNAITNGAGYITGNQTITLSGDVTGSGTTSISTNIAANVVGAAELNVSGNGTAGQVLTSDGDGTFSWTTLTTGGITGSGTTNYIPKFTGTTSLGNSLVYDNGTNVGIGTASPGAKLSIGGVSGELLRLDDSSATGNPYMSFYQAGGRRSYIQHLDASDLLTFASEYGGIKFMTGTGGTETEKMRILADGNVGINTTAPTEKLAVTGNIETTETANGVKIGFNVGDSFTLNGANTAHYGLSCGSSTSVPLVLSGYHGVAIATNGLERVRVISTGEVGIGVTNPAEKLEVVGNIKANNYINQRVAWNSTFSHTTGTGVWMYIPVAYITEQTADTYYLNWIAAYGGRVRKVVLRGAGTGNTQTATTTQFRVMVNGSTVYTTGTLTVTGTSPNKVVSYEFGDSDAVFSATDRVQVLFNSNGLWYNAAVGIIIEYTE